MIGQILKQFQKLLCMFVIHLITSHHVLPSPLITNSTLHKRHVSLDESENSNNVFTVDDPNEMGDGKIRHKRQECQGSFQCADDQWCYDNMCDYPCPRLDCESVHPPDGRCMVRDHQPVCVTAEGLTEQELLRQNGGCAFSSDCGANEWCHNDRCEDPCLKMNCGAMYDDGKCSVENHQPVCKPSDEFINPDDSGLNRGKGEACSNSRSCPSEMSCNKGRCSDPCEKLRCETKDGKQYYLTQTQTFSGKTHSKKVFFDVEHKCVVFNHVARCTVLYSNNPQDFTEVDA